MRTILKGSSALFAVALLGLSTRSLAYNRIEKPLYAGQHILIGKLVVEQIKKTESNRTVKYLRVTYDTTGSDWVMTATHLYVSKNEPTRAAPGRFPFKHEGLDNVKTDSYEIPLSTLLCSNQELYIAAHADVCEEVTTTPCEPDYQATFDLVTGWTTAFFAAGGPNGAYRSYFSIALDGTADSNGWCLDYGVRDPVLNTPYDLTVSPSYNPDGTINPTAASVVGASSVAPPNPNLDKINWIINQSWSMAQGYVDIRMSPVQVAIWYFTNGVLPESIYGGALYRGLAWDIINAANQYGVGFKPSCGEKQLVVVSPSVQIASGLDIRQPAGLEVEVVGKTTMQCETAWATSRNYVSSLDPYDPTKDKRFRTGWGSYFKYTVK